MSTSSEFKKTSWMSEDGFLQGVVQGFVGGKWSWDLVEVHDYGDVPVGSGSGYDSENAAVEGMQGTLDGERLVPMSLDSLRGATIAGSGVRRFRST